MANRIAKTIYAQQAVREYMGSPRPKVSRSVRMKIDRLLAQINESHAVLIDGIYHPSPAFTSILSKEVTVRIDGHQVDVNPFTCDAIDIFLMLKARDSDQAQRQNGQGFNKPDSVIARRLLGKIEGQGLSPTNVLEMFAIAYRYRNQIADEISRCTGIREGEVADILKARFQIAAVTRSLRMVSITDTSLGDEPAAGSKGGYGYQTRKQPKQAIRTDTA
ncbi:hypothetical protein G6L37_04515 [Agrobacterium rubi]|nr:hypothetical protein [Agrobacterium rubi]NTF24616.1 hypothetical protein [Agrobacterium rubi]